VNCLQYTPSVSTIILSGRTYSSQNVRQIWESTLSKSDYLVGHRSRTWDWIFKDFVYISRGEQALWVFKCHFSTIFQLYIDLWATLPAANMVQGRNTLGYLRTRTFYIPERKYAYKYASITKCLTVYCEMYCNHHFLLQPCAHTHVWWKAIAIFRYFVIIILYCKSIHPFLFLFNNMVRLLFSLNGISK
jgi:hypothetical protein